MPSSTLTSLWISAASGPPVGFPRWVMAIVAVAITITLVTILVRLRRGDSWRDDDK